MKIPYKEGSTLLANRQNRAPHRSKSTIGSYYERKPKHKVSKYEVLGLSDPDGTEFYEEKRASGFTKGPRPLVQTGRHLRENAEVVWMMAAEKRAFVRDYAHLKLLPNFREVDMEA